MTGTTGSAAWWLSVVERFEAGMPQADDTMKCRLVPLSRQDYDVTFTEGQWAVLQETFPDGVCDHGKPGVGVRETVPWLTYQEADGSVIHGGSCGAPTAAISRRQSCADAHRMFT